MHLRLWTTEKAIKQHDQKLYLCNIFAVVLVDFDEPLFSSFATSCPKQAKNMLMIFKDLWIKIVKINNFLLEKFIKSIYKMFNKT